MTVVHVINVDMCTVWDNTCGTEAYLLKKKKKYYYNFYFLIITITRGTYL